MSDACIDRRRSDAVLLIPLVAAALLALLPGYRLGARINIAGGGLTFSPALSLFVGRR